MTAAEGNSTLGSNSQTESHGSALAVSDQQQQKQIIRQLVEQLAKVSTDLERNAKMASSAVNMIQAEAMRKRVNELQATQTRLMEQLVAMHPDQAARERFEKLTDKIEQLKSDIKSATEMEELQELEAEIESSVNEWVHQFQTLVANLMGAPAPPEPIFDRRDS